MPQKTKAPPSKESQRKEQQLPKNWPKDLPYLTDQTYSSAVTQDQRVALSRTTPETVSYAKIPPEALKTPYPGIEISTIKDKDHPAYGQRGLFASQHLEPDSLVCLYLGLVHTNSLSDTDPYSDYDLSYDGETDLSIDASSSGNESRFANDYRTIADRPNAEFRDCFIQVKSEKRKDGIKWERRVAIFVLSAGKAGKRKAEIKPGEEILVSYGKGFWESRQMLAKFRADFGMREYMMIFGVTHTIETTDRVVVVKVADAALTA